MISANANDPRLLEESSSHGPPLVQISIILRRHWRLLGMVWLFTVAGVAVYTFTSTRLYRSQAQLEIRAETPKVGMIDAADPSLIASRLMWTNYYRTQEAILTSPTVIQKTLDNLPSDVRLDFDAFEGPVLAFSDNLDIENVRSSFIMRVGYVGPSPSKATQIVNTLVNLYLEEANTRLSDMKSGVVEDSL